MIRDIEGESTGCDIPSGLMAVSGHTWVMPNMIIEQQKNP